jgi:hypothetical protein
MSYRNGAGSSIAGGIAGGAGSSIAGGIAGGAASATPWGAIAQAAASVLNTTITGLFNTSGNKAKKAQIEAQTAKINQDARLDVLSNAQKYYLAEQMAAAQTQAQREKLLNDAAVSLGNTTIAAYEQIKIAQESKNQNMIIFAGVGALALVGLVIFITNKKS